MVGWLVAVLCCGCRRRGAGGRVLLRREAFSDGWLVSGCAVAAGGEGPEDEFFTDVRPSAMVGWLLTGLWLEEDRDPGDEFFSDASALQLLLRLQPRGPASPAHPLHSPALPAHPPLQDEEAGAYRLGAGDEQFADFSDLQLKPDHYNRCARCSDAQQNSSPGLAQCWLTMEGGRSTRAPCWHAACPAPPTPARTAAARHRPWPDALTRLRCRRCRRTRRRRRRRPLWVCPDARIFLETFSPVYKQVGRGLWGWGWAGECRPVEVGAGLLHFPGDLQPRCKQVGGCRWVGAASWLQGLLAVAPSCSPLARAQAGGRVLA